MNHPQSFKPAGNVPYREVVGSLMYLAIGSRPDIAFALSYVCQHMENPLLIRSHLFSDADFAGDIDTRRSHTGFVFML